MTTNNGHKALNDYCKAIQRIGVRDQRTKSGAKLETSDSKGFTEPVQKMSVVTWRLPMFAWQLK